MTIRTVMRSNELMNVVSKDPSTDLPFSMTHEDFMKEVFYIAKAANLASCIKHDHYYDSANNVRRCFEVELELCEEVLSAYQTT